MEDLSQISIPPMPKIERPKRINIEFEGDSFPMFESLIKVVLAPLGYRAKGKIIENGKTVIPMIRTKLQ